MSFRATSFFILFFFSIIKFFGPERGFSDDSFNLYQLLGLMFFLITSLVLNDRNNIHKYNLNQFLTLFFISTVISSFLSLNFISILYSFLFLINTICIYLIFSDSTEKVIDTSKFMPIVIVSLMLFQLYLYGVDILGRDVGNFEPNQFAILALCAIALNFFTSNNIIFRLMIAITSLFLIVITTSRGALGATLIFIITYFGLYIFKNYSFKKFFNYSIIFALFIFVIFLLNFDSIKFYFNNISLYFELTSSERGLQSGFTGRDILWINAMDQFYSHPIFGSGLRNFDLRTHSTYIMLLTETGIFGFITFFLFFVSTIYNGLLLTLNDYDDCVNVSLSYIISMFCYAFIEKSVLLFTMPNSLLLFFFAAYILHAQCDE